MHGSSRRLGREWARPRSCTKWLRARARVASSCCQRPTVPTQSLADSFQVQFSHWNFSWSGSIPLENVLAPRSRFLFPRHDRYCNKLVIYKILLSTSILPVGLEALPVSLLDWELDLLRYFIASMWWRARHIRIAINKYLLNEWMINLLSDFQLATSSFWALVLHLEMAVISSAAFPFCFKVRQYWECVLWTLKQYTNVSEAVLQRCLPCLAWGQITAQEQINPLACSAGPPAKTGFCSLNGCKKQR